MKQQKTIKTEAKLAGKGLFGGKDAKVVFRPGEPNTGVVFVRKDLDEPERVEVCPDNIVQRDRRSALQSGAAVIETPEHCLAAIHALDIDNLIIEMEGSELPGFDGSSEEYFRTLQKCGIEIQDAVQRPIIVSEDRKSVV